jgi:hypothetical protein
VLDGLRPRVEEEDGGPGLAEHRFGHAPEHRPAEGAPSRGREHDEVRPEGLRLVQDLRRRIAEADGDLDRDPLQPGLHGAQVVRGLGVQALDLLVDVDHDPALSVDEGVGLGGHVEQPHDGACAAGEVGHHRDRRFGGQGLVQGDEHSLGHHLLLPRAATLPHSAPRLRRGRRHRLR